MKIKIILSLAAVLFLTGTMVASRAADAPPWELKGLDGKSIRSSDFKGKVVVVDFWATWCGPCRMEIPDLVELQKEYGKQGLVIIGASVDEAGAGAVKAVVQKLGVNYPVGLADDRLQQAFGGIEAIPATFIMDRAGHLAKSYMGLVDKKDFESEIKSLLAP